jgi:hypothetical protein
VVGGRGAVSAVGENSKSDPGITWNKGSSESNMFIEFTVECNGGPSQCLLVFFCFKSSKCIWCILNFGILVRTKQHSKREEDEEEEIGRLLLHPDAAGG